MDQLKATTRPAGYSALLDRYKVRAIPNWHRSVISESATRRTDSTANEVVETYPAAYWPGESPGDHLEFALKYDGMNLGLLAVLLPAIGAEEVTRYVSSKPTGKYARRIWHFYEMLTGDRLALADITQQTYIDLLDDEEHFTSDRREPIRRQRINNNLLGDASFCPTVRRTAMISAFISRDLAARCRALISTYSPDLLRRALSYLFTKETKSSFEIESIKPDANRTERFISLLRAALKEDLCTKPRLIDLQNQIVDPRFKEDDYRDSQNYVGQTVSVGKEHVHYVCPKPEHVAALMAGLISSHGRMERAGIHPVVHAAIVGYGFVFVHPFEDGNGRIHRLLIHNILSRRGFVPDGVIFPVSAAMLKQPSAYDSSLEAFSGPLQELVEYTFDDRGRLTVQNDPGLWYRYPDMTVQVESLFNFVDRTIETELVEEIVFLANYDETKRAVQAIVDMPDRDIDLFIRFCLQNNGRLSQRKRESHFQSLTDVEVERLERAVAEGYRQTENGSGKK